MWVQIPGGHLLHGTKHGNHWEEHTHTQDSVHDMFMPDRLKDPLLGHAFKSSKLGITACSCRNVRIMPSQTIVLMEGKNGLYRSMATAGGRYAREHSPGSIGVSACLSCNSSQVPYPVMRAMMMQWIALFVTS